MRTRYFSLLAIALAAGFLVVASQAFALFDIANLALGIGIGVLVVALAMAVRYRHHPASVAIGMAIAVVSAWTVVTSQVFSLGAIQDLTFANALGILGLALAGLTIHELSTERIVHSLAPHMVVPGASGTEEYKRHLHDPSPAEHLVKPPSQRRKPSPAAGVEAVGLASLTPRSCLCRGRPRRPARELSLRRAEGQIGDLPDLRFDPWTESLL